MTGSTDDILDLQLLSSAASPQLSKALHALEAARPNIVYLDQLDPWLSSRIIAVTPRTP